MWTDAIYSVIIALIVLLISGFITWFFEKRYFPMFISIVALLFFIALLISGIFLRDNIEKIAAGSVDSKQLQAIENYLELISPMFMVDCNGC